MRNLVSLFFCLLPSLAMAKDTIWLANGDRIVGDIVFKQGDRVVVETDYAGRVHIDWDKVATLETGKPVAVKIKSVPGTATSVLSLSQSGTVICFQCKVKLIELRDIDSLNYSAWWSGNRRRGPR
jgi:hypothetical protein